MGKISYKDKKTINDLPNIDEERKWTSQNANEVKSVVNDIDTNLLNLTDKVNTMEQTQISNTNNITQHTSEISTLQQVDQHHNAEIGRVEGITTAINNRINTNLDPRITAAEGSITHNANVNNNQEARIAALEARPQTGIIPKFHTFRMRDYPCDNVGQRPNANSNSRTWYWEWTIPPLPSGEQPTHNNLLGLWISGGEAYQVSFSFSWVTATKIQMKGQISWPSQDWNTWTQNINVQLCILVGPHFT